MASCSLGILNVRFLKVNCSRTRICTLRHCGTNCWIVRMPVKYVGFVISTRSTKPNVLSCIPSLEAECTTISEDSSDTESSGLTSNLIPNRKEVEYLLTQLCDTSSIAEFELKLDGFQLRVRRGLTDKIEPPPPPIPASVDVTVKAPDLNGSVSTSSLAILKPEHSSGRMQSFLDNAADEGLTIITSPNVGFFRRSRTIKGKQAPPSCEVKQEVKEGKVVCYIEQFGGQLPVTSNVSGEVIRILQEDGEPVGYGDALIAILPSFPGIKALQ